MADSLIYFLFGAAVTISGALVSRLLIPVPYKPVWAFFVGTIVGALNLLSVKAGWR